MGNNRMQAWFKLAGGKSDWFYFGMCEIPKGMDPVKETERYIYFGFEEGIMKYEK